MDLHWRRDPELGLDGPRHRHQGRGMGSFNGLGFKRKGPSTDTRDPSSSIEASRSSTRDSDTAFVDLRPGVEDLNMDIGVSCSAFVDSGSAAALSIGTFASGLASTGSSSGVGDPSLDARYPKTSIDIPMPKRRIPNSSANV